MSRNELIIIAECGLYNIDYIDLKPCKTTILLLHRSPLVIFQQEIWVKALYTKIYHVTYVSDNIIILFPGDE